MFALCALRVPDIRRYPPASCERISGPAAGIGAGFNGIVVIDQRLVGVDQIGVNTLEHRRLARRRVPAFERGLAGERDDELAVPRRQRSSARRIVERAQQGADAPRAL